MEAAASNARLVVIGTAYLVHGFSLIGAEIYADADSAKVEEVLADLVKSGDEGWCCWRATSPMLADTGWDRLRNEGGRIVVTELPHLAAPYDYAPAVDDVVRAVLGPDALK